VVAFEQDPQSFLSGPEGSGRKNVKQTDQVKAAQNSASFHAVDGVPDWSGVPEWSELRS